MPGFFDDTRIDIECQKCGHKLSERVGKLKNTPIIPCPSCGTQIQVEGKLRSDLKPIEKGIDDIERLFRDLGKRR